MMFCLNLVDNQEYKNYKQTKKIKDMKTLREIKNRKYYAVYEELCAGMVGIAKYTWFCPILQLARITLKNYLSKSKALNLLLAVCLSWNSIFVYWLFADKHQWKTL